MKRTASYEAVLAKDGILLRKVKYDELVRKALAEGEVTRLSDVQLLRLLSADDSMVTQVTQGGSWTEYTDERFQMQLDAMTRCYAGTNTNAVDNLITGKPRSAEDYLAVVTELCRMRSGLNDDERCLGVLNTIHTHFRPSEWPNNQPEGALLWRTTERLGDTARLLDRIHGKRVLLLGDSTTLHMYAASMCSVLVTRGVMDNFQQYINGSSTTRCLELFGDELDPLLDSWPALDTYCFYDNVIRARAPHA